MKKLIEALSVLLLGLTFLTMAQAAAPTSIETRDLMFLIQEEKLAHDVYVRLGEKYSTMPFVNIPQI